MDLAVLGFGPEGWGALLLRAALTSVAVSVCAFGLGLALGALGAWGRLSRSPAARGVSLAYVTVLRGIPDLLVIYLFYFGGSEALSAIGHLLGAQGFLGLNGFLVGMLAVGIVSGAYQTEVFRGAWLAIPAGQIEAARVAGMGPLLLLARVAGPQALRLALPGLGNVWQMVIKESALISVTGLVELLRQVHVAAGSTGDAFQFYVAGGALYLVITFLSGLLFRAAEHRAARGVLAR